MEKFVYANILNGINASWSTKEKAKFIYDEICKVSSYDERFIYSEDPKQLEQIFNYPVDIHTPTKTKLICKTLNILYSQLLTECGIRNTIIYKPSDINPHFNAQDVALVFYDEIGNKYFTSIAADIQRCKYGLKTQYFGRYDEKFEENQKENITIIRADELRAIDETVGFVKEGEEYSDIVFDLISKEIKNTNYFKNFLLSLDASIVRNYLNDDSIAQLSDKKLQEYIKNLSIDDLLKVKMNFAKIMSYHDSSFGLIEKKKFSINLFNSLFNKTEKKFFDTFDMIKSEGDEVKLISIIRFNLKNSNEYLYYIHSDETYSYELLTIEEVLKIDKEYKSYNGKRLVEYNDNSNFAQNSEDER